MKDYSYHHEQIDLLLLLASALDDTFLYRYDANTRERGPKIEVKYMFGPKQRVMHSITNPEKSLHLPVVGLDQGSISRDPDRIMHKHQFMYRPSLNNSAEVAKIPMPIPVKMEVAMTIFAKYKEDIDQIAQNFITYCNPYFVVSWKVPEEFQIDFTDELRTRIEWSGTLTYNTPKVLQKEDKFRIEGDTAFTIYGWLFPPYEQKSKPIYEIYVDLKAIKTSDKLIYSEDYNTLSAYFSESETVSISAYPSFTNLFYSTSGTNIPLENGTSVSLQQNNNFFLLGKRFSYNNTWYLSSNVSLDYEYEQLSAVKSPTISAYRIPDSQVTVFSDNVVNINIPYGSLSSVGEFTIVTANSAAWAKTDGVFSFV